MTIGGVDERSNMSDDVNDDIPEEDFVDLSRHDAAEKIIQDKIMHTLSIYPKLSMSMLQVGIGTALTPKLWHPVFERLLKEGKITKQEITAHTPTTGREQVYTIVSKV